MSKVYFQSSRAGRVQSQISCEYHQAKAARNPLWHSSSLLRSWRTIHGIVLIACRGWVGIFLCDKRKTIHNYCILWKFCVLNGVPWHDKGDIFEFYDVPTTKLSDLCFGNDFFIQDFNVSERLFHIFVFVLCLERTQIKLWIFGQFR